MDEHHQREEAPAQRRAVEEVVGDRLAEQRQGIEPFRRRDSDVLRKLIPYQPVPADAAQVYECEQWHARQPCEEAAAAQPVHGEFAKDVQHDDDDQRIGRVAMQAAHDAGGIPLVVRHVFDRFVGVGDACIEKDVQVDARCRNDPVEIPAQRAEPGERVVALPESVLEDCFEAGERAREGTFDQFHCEPIGRVAIP